VNSIYFQTVFSDASFQILSLFLVPLETWMKVDLGQPVFAANFIKGSVKAQPNGGWAGEATFKLHFKHGGAIDFGRAMLEAARMGE
jgi:hypothetical protein